MDTSQTSKLSFSTPSSVTMDTIQTRKLSISPTQVLLWLVSPFLLAALGTASALTAGLSLLVLSVPLLLLWRTSTYDNTTREHLETLVWTFFGTATIGLAAAAAVQTILCQLLAPVLFGDQAKDYFKEFASSPFEKVPEHDQKRRASMAWTWQYFVFLLVFTYIGAGFLEELLKYTAISIARRSRPSPISENEYLHYAVAATLGFSITENIAFIYTSRNESALMVITTVIERMTIGTPGHVLSGYMIALEMINRDLRGNPLPLWKILGTPTMYHSTWDFLLFAVSAMYGNVGWRHPNTLGRFVAMLAPALGILGLAAMHVQSKMQHLRLQS